MLGAFLQFMLITSLMNHSHFFSPAHQAMRMIALLTIIICGASLPSRASSSRDLLHKEMDNLKAAIKSIPDYRAAKERSITDMKGRLLHIPESDHKKRSLALLEIGYDYRTYSADSAVVYFSKAEKEAIASGDELMIIRTKIGTLSGLSAAGFFPEACQLINEIESHQIPCEAKAELFVAGGRLYTYMYNYVGAEAPLADTYRNKYMEYDDSLLQVLPSNSIIYRFLRAERLVEQGHYPEARKALEVLLKEVPQKDNIYGKTAYQMAEVYNRQGDPEGYAAYLAKAAVSDIQGCVNEGWALPVLASWLYEKGDIEDAYSYINISLSDAMSGNARMRTVSLARMFPAIDTAYQSRLRSSRTKLFIWASIGFIFAITSIIMLVILWKQVKRRRAAMKKLAETAMLQESYLGNFVALCSSYSARLDDCQKLVVRKLASGQTDELMKAMKSGKFSDKTEDFHGIIDKTLLALYPDFVDEVNALLRPEERMEKRKDTLPAELRIYALYRLGVNESSKIASILQYSANTVYAYRNKMRNKAINRDTFEADISQIGRQNEH